VWFPLIASGWLAFGSLIPTPPAIVYLDSSLSIDSAHEDWHCDVVKELPWEILWCRIRGKKNCERN
jgi:hypothetical protein